MAQPRLNPIRSEAPMQRFQIDLVDMRHNRQVLDDRRYIDKNLSKKDKEAKAKATKEKKETRYYEWIAHVMDHFTKFHILWAQETKTMEETADGFERYVLAYFGLSKKLNSADKMVKKHDHKRNKKTQEFDVGSNISK